MRRLIQFMQRRDVNFFYFFNRKLHYDLFNPVMKVITQLGSFGATLLITLSLYFSSNELAKNLSTKIAINVACSAVIVQVIKKMIKRPRPYKTLGDVKPIMPPRCQNSFPSGHTCAAFSMGLALAEALPGLSMAFICMSSLVGISRMYLGVHYPSDVIFGYGVAALTHAKLVPLLAVLI